MTSPSICPAQFFDTFIRVAEEEYRSILEKWDSWCAYTNLVREAVFEKTANYLDLLYYGHDYWTLDGIMYREKDIQNFQPCTTYAHSICVAIEHENSAGSSMIEMNKLQLFNTPLKVLITYPNETHTERSLLDRYATAIERADIFGDFSTHRRQLVIFGSKKDDALNWSGHVYAGGGFESIAARSFGEND